MSRPFSRNSGSRLHSLGDEPGGIAEGRQSLSARRSLPELRLAPPFPPSEALPPPMLSIKARLLQNCLRQRLRKPIGSAALTAAGGALAGIIGIGAITGAAIIGIGPITGTGGIDGIAGIIIERGSMRAARCAALAQTESSPCCAKRSLSVTWLRHSDIAADRPKLRNSSSPSRCSPDRLAGRLLAQRSAGSCRSRTKGRALSRPALSPSASWPTTGRKRLELARALPKSTRCAAPSCAGAAAATLSETLPFAYPSGAVVAGGRRDSNPPDRLSGLTEDGNRLRSGWVAICGRPLPFVHFIRRSSDAL